MKKLNFLLASLIAIWAFSSCKKSVDVLQLDGGSINVTNAIVGASTLNMMTPNGVISASNTISANNYAIMPVKSGSNSLSFGLAGVAATSTDPAIPAVVYDTQTVSIDNTSRYSLFLAGTSTSAIDNILIKESYTQIYADSVCGIRFINLAPSSNSINVNLQGSANGSEASNLAYKAYSNFKQYPAKMVNASYIFEFRDATTGNLLATYKLSTPYFHNVTLCLNGFGTGVILDKDF
jgi:hypothetical protein